MPMSSKKMPPRLGRGLAALLGDSPLQSNGEQGLSVKPIPMDQIDANPFQPRMDFDPAELENLAQSIRSRACGSQSSSGPIQPRKTGTRSLPVNAGSAQPCWQD